MATDRSDDAPVIFPITRGPRRVFFQRTAEEVALECQQEEGRMIAEHAQDQQQRLDSQSAPARGAANVPGRL